MHMNLGLHHIIPVVSWSLCMVGGRAWSGTAWGWRQGILVQVPCWRRLVTCYHSWPFQGLHGTTSGTPRLLSIPH